MGRQTIWGGAGKPPSREVMQGCRQGRSLEMMDRIRTNKAAQGQANAALAKAMAAVDGLEMAAAHAAKGPNAGGGRAGQGGGAGRGNAQPASARSRGPRPTIPLATTMHSLHGPMPIWEPTSDTATPSIAMEATARVDNPTPCVPA